MRLFFILFPFLLFLINPEAMALSTARFPEIPSKSKPLSFSLQTEFYRSISNYEEIGGYKPLSKKNYLQYFAAHPSLSYSPLPHYINFELFANSFYISSQSLNTVRSSFRPTVLGGGVKLYYKYKQLYSGLELRGGYPIINHFPDDQAPITGDGSVFIEPGLWLLYHISNNIYVYENFSFRYRMTLSNLIFNRVGGVLKTQYTDIGLSVDAFFSLPSSQILPEAETRLRQLPTLNGGSYRFSALNPFLLSFTAWMEFKFKPVFATLYFNGNSIGQNYAKGLTFGLMTKFKWNTKSSFISKKRKSLDFNFGELETPQEEKEEPRSSKPSQKKYLEEEEDPYGGTSVNKELKHELKSLRY